MPHQYAPVPPPQLRTHQHQLQESVCGRLVASIKKDEDRLVASIKKDERPPPLVKPHPLAKAGIIMQPDLDNAPWRILKKARHAARAPKNAAVVKGPAAIKTTAVQIKQETWDEI